MSGYTFTNTTNIMEKNKIPEFVRVITAVMKDDDLKQLGNERAYLDYISRVTFH